MNVLKNLKARGLFSHLFSFGLSSLEPLDGDAPGVEVDPGHDGGVDATWNKDQAGVSTSEVPGNYLEV